ncbi:uncharacterized protein TNCV_4572831 [Trichonephila clavipes]|nr:uncharacterized protein TNCV_4572831 [Trichonephila clavipes]
MNLGLKKENLSLRVHALDLDDSVMQLVTIILLTETWINNEENIDVPNFHCIAKFQRHNHRAVRIAIYKNKGDTTYVTSEMDAASNTTESFGFNEPCIGEICPEKCRAENGQIILMVTIYISPNQSAVKIIEFFHKAGILKPDQLF